MTYPSPENRPFTAEEIIELIDTRVKELNQACIRETGGWYQSLFSHQIEVLEDLLIKIRAGKYPR